MLPWGADPRTAWPVATAQLTSLLSIMGSRPEDCMAHDHGATISLLSYLTCTTAGAGAQLTSLLSIMGGRPKNCMANGHGATISLLSYLTCTAAGEPARGLLCFLALWGADPRTAWRDDFDAFTTDVHGRRRRHAAFNPRVTLHVRARPQAPTRGLPFWGGANSARFASTARGLMQPHIPFGGGIQHT